MGVGASRSMSPDRFRDKRYCDNEDSTFLICYVLLREHVIKASCEFMKNVPQVAFMKNAAILANSVVNDLKIVEI